METENTDLDGDWEAVEVEEVEADEREPSRFEKYSKRELVDKCALLSDQLDDLSAKWEALHNDHKVLDQDFKQAISQRDEAERKLEATERAFTGAQDEIRGLRSALASQVNEVALLIDVLHRVTDPTPGIPYVK